MNSKIQPILCCVGDSVAGRPTQFLMERAFLADDDDWRVITVEIERDQFQTALDGMRAMKFTAIRFFPEFQHLAADLILDQAALPFSAVTSVIRHGDGWQCWDNQGFGLLDLIRNAAPAATTLLWLHGQSRLTHSLMRSMETVDYAPERLMWSESNEVREESSQPVDNPSGDGMSEDAGPTQAEAPLALIEIEQTLGGILSQPNVYTHVVVVGESLAALLPLLRGLEVQGAIRLVLATDQLLTRQHVNDAWARGEVTIFAADEQLIAAEAYDFHRWTGKPADMDLLRDAYDEYADF